MLSAVPPLICNPDLTEEFVSAMKTLANPTLNGYPDINAPASEDFASIANKIPSTYMYLSAGFEDERGDYPVHHPKALFNEDVCPIDVYKRQQYIHSERSAGTAYAFACSDECPGTKTN